MNLYFLNFPDNDVYHEFESACRDYRKLDEEAEAEGQKNKNGLESIMKQIAVKKQTIECFLRNHQSQQVIFGILDKYVFNKNNETYIEQTICMRRPAVKSHANLDIFAIGPALEKTVDEDWNLIITMNTKQRTPTFTYNLFLSGELCE